MVCKFTFQYTSEGLAEVEADIGKDNFRPLFIIYYRAYPDAWKKDEQKTGAYILLDFELDGDSWKAYVGQSTEGGITSRMSTHIYSPPEGMENWSMAVAIYGHIDENEKFQTMTYEDAHRLETELYANLKELLYISLQNTTPPKSSSSPQQREKIIPLIEPTTELLKVIGINLEKKPKISKTLLKFKDLESIPQSQPQFKGESKSKNKPKNKTGKKKRTYNVSLAELVKAGYLSKGQKLKSTNPKYPANAEIVELNGKICVQVLEYGIKIGGDIVLKEVTGAERINWATPNPNIAGKVRGTMDGSPKTANGWTFWALVEGKGETLDDIRSHYEKRQAK